MAQRIMRVSSTRSEAAATRHPAKSIRHRCEAPTQPRLVVLKTDCVDPIAVPRIQLQLARKHNSPPFRSSTNLLHPRHHGPAAHCRITRAPRLRRAGRAPFQAGSTRFVLSATSTRDIDSPFAPPASCSLGPCRVRPRGRPPRRSRLPRVYRRPRRVGLRGACIVPRSVGRPRRCRIVVSPAPAARRVGVRAARRHEPNRRGHTAWRPRCAGPSSQSRSPRFLGAPMVARAPDTRVAAGDSRARLRGGEA